MKTEYYVNNSTCAPRWRCFTFWLHEGLPYDRFLMELDGYELVNTSALLAHSDRRMLVEHEFEFAWGRDHGWELVEAEDPKEAWKIYDERRAA